MVVNVFYILVYFGVMSEMVKLVIFDVDVFWLGDVIVINDLFCGGFYLFDVIVISLVFDLVGFDLIFFIVSCVYYVEIGGMMLGFMLF